MDTSPICVCGAGAGQHQLQLPSPACALWIRTLPARPSADERGVGSQSLNTSQEHKAAARQRNSSWHRGAGISDKCQGVVTSPWQCTYGQQLSRADGPLSCPRYDAGRGSIVSAARNVGRKCPFSAMYPEHHQRGAGHTGPWNSSAWGCFALLVCFWRSYSNSITEQ